MQQVRKKERRSSFGGAPEVRFPLLMTFWADGVGDNGERTPRHTMLGTCFCYAEEFEIFEIRMKRRGKSLRARGLAGDRKRSIRRAELRRWHQHRVK